MIAIFIAVGLPLSAASRYALVIGNGNYEGAYLRNPVNDAIDLANLLEELDFKVTKATDVKQKEMEQLIEDFGRKIGREDIALFYYSGHGLQVKGNNYLIPLEASIDDEHDIKYEAVHVNWILDELSVAKMNIFILDACRNNPFKRVKSIDRGLAQINSTPPETFIAYATAPGKVAVDGLGRNSPYTKYLMEQMQKPNVPIERMFKNVRSKVIEETHNEQIPWENTCLTDDFIFCMSGYTKPTINKEESDIEKIKTNLDNMIFVPGSTFQMGSDNGSIDEKPVHTVSVDDFYIGQYEITNREYIDFLNEKKVLPNGSYNNKEYIDMNDINCAIGYRNEKFYFKGSKYANDEDCPVTEVTWFGADAYCKWKGGRLPTEAEWEYAARGGNNSVGYIYSGSSNLSEVAWFKDNSDNKTHTVGRKQPNELDIYDMSGNVWEWCNDWFANDYFSISNSNNPKGPSVGNYRVIKGGSWGNDISDCRITTRNRSRPNVSGYTGGFRIVKSVE